VRELYKIPDLEVYINRRRLELLGHAIKTSQTGMATKILMGSHTVKENRKAQVEIVERCRD
jgi:hypothetical protein